MENQRTKLPTKTKIAVWWLVITGIIWVITLIPVGVYFAYFKSGNPDVVGMIAFCIWLIVLPVASLFTLSVIFLVLRKRWAWIVSLVILSIATFCLLPVYITPLVLVIRDRGNYRDRIYEQNVFNNLAIAAICIGVSMCTFSFGYLYLALDGIPLGVLVGMAAVICGVISVVQTKRFSAKGQWMAIMGILFGIMGIMGWSYALTLA